MPSAHPQLTTYQVFHASQWNVVSFAKISVGTRHASSCFLFWIGQLINHPFQYPGKIEAIVGTVLGLFSREDEACLVPTIKNLPLTEGGGGVDKPYKSTPDRGRG